MIIIQILEMSLLILAQPEKLVCQNCGQFYSKNAFISEVQDYYEYWIWMPSMFLSFFFFFPDNTDYTEL
jgi:hypothetical protein